MVTMVTFPFLGYAGAKVGLALDLGQIELWMQTFICMYGALHQSALTGDKIPLTGIL